MTTVLEGTWEEIAVRAPELAGRRVRLVVFDPPKSKMSSSNDLEQAQSRAKDFLEWADGHPANPEPLSEYALSRESMYTEDY